MVNTRCSAWKRHAASLGNIRLSLVAALGALVLSIAAPDPTRAAPTPAPTLAQQQPTRAPSTTPLPTTLPTLIPSPSSGPGHPPGPTPSIAPSPAPLRAPAIAASPSPVQATQASITGIPTAAPSSSPVATPDDSSLDPPPDDGSEVVEAPVDWQAFVPTDVADHLATMDRAARDSGCGVPWHLLAAIARVESDFGRNMATSSAGAMGYGQFLPSSWRSFGNDGNVYDYRDALPAIATYLCESGLERDPRAALFAYNHADWYVDLVLELAVRYDRMAPGAPTPDVLDVGPAAQSGMHMHYADGRDVRRDTKPRANAAQADWLGVPWRGRAPGASISASSLEGTTLAMLRGAFGLASDVPQPTEPRGGGLQHYADRAWAAGLLGVPVQPPVLLPVPDERRPDQNARWSMADIRRNIQRGRPVVALVASRLLPGHSSREGVDDQPLVLIGKTPTGLVYSDPSFSSSLGYGLELSDADFLSAWQAASSPALALAFSLRPRALVREAHVHVAEPPPVYARLLPTPTPPAPVAEPPVAEATLAPLPAVDALSAVGATVETSAAPEAAPLAARASPPADDRSWVGLFGTSVALVAALVWRVRARR